MSPHAADRFSGHMPEGDPRDLMWASGGCDWPTVMAHSYLLCSTNATGLLSFLNTLGILFVPTTPLGSSWEFWWWGRPIVAPVVVPLMVKRFPHDGDKYRIELQITFLFGMLYSTTDFPSGNCNKTHHLTEATVGWPVVLGSTGDGIRLMQVEFDETRPPGGWPP